MWHRQGPPPPHPLYYPSVHAINTDMRKDGEKPRRFVGRIRQPAVFKKMYYHASSRCFT